VFARRELEGDLAERIDVGARVDVGRCLDLLRRHVRRRADVSRLREFGWAPTLSLREGIESTYKWFLAHQADARGLAADLGRTNVQA
jgi:nucleoside-diphosphate-sugar epimerase